MRTWRSVGERQGARVAEGKGEWAARGLGVHLPPWELGGCTLDVQCGGGPAVARVTGVGAGIGQLAAAQLQDAAPTR